MKRCFSSLRGRSFAGVMVLLVSGVLFAEDPEVYESLPEIAIGKVFFSPLEREQLDQNRDSAAPPENANRPSATSRRNSTKNDGAGFWTSSRGLRKVYSGDDFVETDEPQEESFPGDVTIARRENSSSEETDDAGN